MAYGLIYQSDFYNTPPFSRLVSVKIYKKDHLGGVTQVRTSQVTISTNYQDDNTPIIGTGAKVVIIADENNISYLEDLLLSYERQFMCTIEYGEGLETVVVFRGYSICDLNERQLLPFAEVTMQFTDYMHRLDGEYPNCTKDMGLNTNLFILVKEMLNLTTLELPLYVNSTLFESSMNKEATDTWLPQVTVQNSLYFETSYTRDNIYNAINKSLQPFSAFIYSFEDKWIIERQEDITRIGNWVSYEGIGVGSVASLKQEWNKQDGDFKYVDCSQIIEYDSGLHTLTLRLKDKELDSLVFNNWPRLDLIPTIVTYLPPQNTLAYRTWYHHNSVSPSERGTERHDIAEWVHYANGTYVQGWFYQFIVYFNTTEQSYPDTPPRTVLSISYTMASDKNMDDTWKTIVPFLLMVDGGPYSGYFIHVGGAITADDPQGRTTTPMINLVGPGSAPYTQIGYFAANNEWWDVSDRTSAWTLNKEIDFSTVDVRIYNDPGTYVYSGTPGVSLEDLLGNPEWQKLVIVFLPARYTITHNVSIDNFAYTHVYPDNYLGDIVIKVNSPDKIDNNIQYYLNENFVKTDEIDLYLFDMANMNYSNAMLEADGFTRTRIWMSENSPDPIPLYEVFAKGKFRKYGRTIHRLKGTIMCDKVLKPFAILTDDNISSETSSGKNMPFILNGFTWDLNAGTYDIEAEEYTEEDVTVGIVGDDAEGNPVPPGYELPDPPLNLHGTQLGSGQLIRMSWDVVSGAVGYVLERQPQIYNGIWIPYWKIVKPLGSELTFDDHIELDTPELPDDTHVTYRVSAYNDKGTSIPSGEVIVHYYT